MTAHRFIPLMVPDIQQHDIDAVVSVLQTGMLVQGEKVQQLENRIAGYLGSQNAIAASNGTATLHLALIACGIGKGDEVIVPAFSYMATANVVEVVGASPVFVDIDPNTFNINTSLIEPAITPETKAIIPVHEFGLACDIAEVCRIARKHNLIVIEDAACALGATEGDRFVGTFGQLGSFSFHPRKAITSGEGGMLTTDDAQLTRILRALRNHGIEIQEGKMEFILPGLNYRMTDFQAALVYSQFERLDFIFRKRDQLAEVYFEELAGIAEIQLPEVPKNKRHTWQTFHIVLDDSVNRDQCIAAMRERGVGTNYGAQCMPDQIFFRDKYRLDCNKLFPNAMRAYNNGLALPLYERIDSDDVVQISKTLKAVLSSL